MAPDRRRNVRRKTDSLGPYDGFRAVFPYSGRIAAIVAYKRTPGEYWHLERSDSTYAYVSSINTVEMNAALTAKVSVSVQKLTEEERKKENVCGRNLAFSEDTCTV